MPFRWSGASTGSGASASTLSVEWSRERSRELLGGDERLVVCHLGGGCSVTAVAGGRSVDTTMGFSPLEGVPMMTRPGSVDPGALLYLLRERHVTVAGLDHALNERSGLAALSGRDSVRAIAAAADAGDDDASLALDVFGHRVAQAVAAMAVAAGGFDALGLHRGDRRELERGPGARVLATRVPRRRARRGRERHCDSGRRCGRRPLARSSSRRARARNWSRRVRRELY